MNKKRLFITVSLTIILALFTIIPLTIYSKDNPNIPEETQSFLVSAMSATSKAELLEKIPAPESEADVTDSSITETAQDIESVVEASETEVRHLAPPIAADSETEETSSFEEVTRDTFTETTEPEPVIIPEEFQVFTTFLYNDTRCKLKFSEEMQYWTYQMAQKYEVPYRIILGLIGVETGWNENVTTETGSNGRVYVGLGCLDEIYNAEKFAERGIDIYTNKGNVEAICWIIRDNMLRYDGNVDLALMAYNGGVGYANNKIADGIYETTYTKRVHYFADSLE